MDQNHEMRFLWSWTESQNMPLFKQISSVLSLPQLTGMSKYNLDYNMKPFKSSKTLKSAGSVFAQDIYPQINYILK
jgi:hypothetical protein